MVGQMYDKPIRNFTIQRPVREEKSRETWLFAVAILLVLVLAIMYIYIPNRMVELDYKFEAAKKTIGDLRQENSVLAMRESELTSLNRLEGEAQKLGFLRPDIARIRFIDGRELAVPETEYLAMNAVREQNPKR
jgi:cell division protein FtsL